MPRNASGTYTLPSGNPVITGTTITSTWANATMTDIGSELTNSLDRNGRGGMLAPFKVADGSAAAPGIAFSNEPSTGWYRSAAAEAAMSITGTQIIKTTPTLVTFNAPIAATGWSGDLSLTGKLTVTRPGQVNTNNFIGWTDSTSSTGFLSIRTGGIGLGSDGNIDFSSGQAGVANAFNVRGRVTTAGAWVLGGVSPAANSTLTVTGVSGSGQITVNNGTAQSFFGGGDNTFSAFGTVTNTPLIVQTNSTERARITAGGQFLLGTTSPGTGPLTLAGSSGAGQITIRNGTAETFVGGGNNTFSAFGTSTLTPLAFFVNSAEYARIDTAGVFTYGGLEVGYRKLNISGSLENGKAVKINSGLTLNAGTAANIGDIATIYNDSAAAVTLTQGTATLRLAGTASTGNRTLAARGIATIWYSTASEIIVSGAGVS